jgi:hypothetical protein
MIGRDNIKESDTLADHLSLTNQIEEIGHRECSAIGGRICPGVGGAPGVSKGVVTVDGGDKAVGEVAATS